MKVSKIVFKPAGFALGGAGGMIAGTVLKQAWKLLAHDKNAPTPPTGTASRAK